MTLTPSSLLHPGRKNGENDKNYDTLDLPKRAEPSKGRPRPLTGTLQSEAVNTRCGIQMSGADRGSDGGGVGVGCRSGVLVH